MAKTEITDARLKPSIDNSQSVQDAFQTAQTQNDMAEVLKELFKEDKIFMMGDLTRDEIAIATRIWGIAELKNLDVWKDMLTLYMKLLLSKNRQSRREILEAIKGYRQNRGFMERLGLGRRDRF